MLPFFKSQGFACPPKKGAADFLQEVPTLAGEGWGKGRGGDGEATASAIAHGMRAAQRANQRSGGTLVPACSHRSSRACLPGAPCRRQSFPPLAPPGKLARAGWTLVSVVTAVFSRGVKQSRAPLLLPSTVPLQTSASTGLASPPPTSLSPPRPSQTHAGRRPRRGVRQRLSWQSPLMPRPQGSGMRTRCSARREWPATARHRAVCRLRKSLDVSFLQAGACMAGSVRLMQCCSFKHQRPACLPACLPVAELTRPAQPALHPGSSPPPHAAMAARWRSWRAAACAGVSCLCRTRAKFTRAGCESVGGVLQSCT